MFSRKRLVIPTGGTQGASTQGSSAGISEVKGTRLDEEEMVAAPGAIASGGDRTAYTKPLQAKQTNSSLTAQPLHITAVDKVQGVLARADAIITFATSINANQPVATLWDRLRAYRRIAGQKKRQQFLEIEGRAFPVSAYLHAYLQYLLNHNLVVPAFDKALANTTQTYAQYRLAGFLDAHDVRLENVIKVQPYTGVGAASAYTENDGAAGVDIVYPQLLGRFWVARSYGANISSLTIRGARAFMIGAAVDLNANFVMKVGERAYVTEEINDIEERIADLFGTAPMSITGAAAAALRGARGQPQDPFTGAAQFYFGDCYKEAQDVTIVINAANAVQVAVSSDYGIECLGT